MAYDGIRNPASQIERRGFAFSWIPIRYSNIDKKPCIGKKAQVLKSTNFDAGLYDITGFSWALIISISHHTLYTRYEMVIK
jgi:hypothetical protein